MKKIEIKRVKELRRERNFYGFWELETRFGSVKLKHHPDFQNEKQETKIEDKMFDELETHNFQK